VPRWLRGRHRGCEGNHGQVAQTGAIECAPEHLAATHRVAFRLEAVGLRGVLPMPPTARGESGDRLYRRGINCRTPRPCGARTLLALRPMGGNGKFLQDTLHLRSQCPPRTAVQRHRAHSKRMLLNRPCHPGSDDHAITGASRPQSMNCTLSAKFGKKVRRSHGSIKRKTS
jgi:hypothetical protein